MTILLNNINVDAESSAMTSNGGPLVIFIRGDDFGGGQVELKIAPPSGTRYSTMNNGTFNISAEVKIDYVPRGAKIKAALVGSSGASNIFVETA